MFSCSVVTCLVLLVNCSAPASTTTPEMDHQPDDGFFRRLRTCNIRGLRFSPTEPELMEYLEDHKTHLATGGGVGGVDHNIIPVLDLNILEPHDIPGKCQTKFPGDKQVWYLMHACPKKYQHSTREDRATPKGYWKATGKPTKVLDKQGRVVGTRKTLVFYTGRAVNKSQNEGKTEWIMHEFRSETPVSANFKSFHFICHIHVKFMPRQSVRPADFQSALQGTPGALITMFHWQQLVLAGQLTL